MKLSIRVAAEQAADRPALVSPEATWSYADLWRQVQAAAQRLTDLGCLASPIGAPAPIALVAEPRLAALALLYAAFELGIPVLLLHPKYTRAEREQLMREQAIEHVFEGRWTPARTTSRPSLSLHGPPDDDRCLAIVPTSGTQGTPKAACLSRRGVVRAAEGSEWNLGWHEGDRWLLSLPYAHVGGLSVLLRCWIARRTVVLPASDGSDAAGALAQAFTHERLTLASVVPTQLEQLLQTVRTPPASLRAVLVGGAAASRDLLERAVRQGWPVLTSYGLTETCGQVATQPYALRGRLMAGVGPALPHVTLRIVDGRIRVRSAASSIGYRHVRDGKPVIVSAHDRDGWLATEDLGHLDERGTLHVLGRADATIITGGENVHPAEVEAALESLPGVRRACVFGVADAAWGTVVAAAIELSSAAPPAAPLEDLIAPLRHRLAAHKLPRRIACLERLPELPSGKLDRTGARALGEPVLRPLGYSRSTRK